LLYNVPGKQLKRVGGMTEGPNWQGPLVGKGEIKAIKKWKI
jgi:hypothetical protein